MNDEEITPSEKQALAALRRDRWPSPLLERRIVAALRDRGVLRPAERWTITLTPMRLFGAAAACVLFAFLGFAAGRWTGGEEERRPAAPPVLLDGMTMAAALQQAGSAYVAALEELAASPGSKYSIPLRQGREVALVTLSTAVIEVAKVVPRDRLAGQLLLALDVRPVEQPTPDENAHRPREVLF